MNSYVKLTVAALLPVFAAVMLYLWGKVLEIEKKRPMLWQVVCGVIFGGLAILGTEWGIPFNGAQANCRDAAVLVAGLLFGGPAGIIAGVIGAVERWIAVAWGIGTYTRVACTVSTLIAGFYAAALRKYLFENRRPGWMISGAIGIVMEVFHLTMVFITNMDTPDKALAVIEACSVPMILANGASVLLATAILTLLGQDLRKRRQTKQRARISQTVQRWLLAAVALAFAVTSWFIFSLQDEIAMAQVDSLLATAIEETAADIEDFDDLNVVHNRHVGENGYILVINDQNKLVSAPEGITDETLMQDGKHIGPADPDVTIAMSFNGEEAFCRYNMFNGYYIISVLPRSEALAIRNTALYVNTFMEILVFAVLFALIYMLIKKVVVNGIQKVNASLSKITGGDLNETVDVRSQVEFDELSDGINATVDTLKRYIDEANARIDKELKLAKDIQSSALPNVFPAFPQRKELDIFAIMDPAKEVGGDFYDFYITGRDMFHFLVADVSGKGIPAAMFMMRAKTELRSLTEADVPLGEVFARGNDALCDGNDAGMFVTAWQAGIDLQTGRMEYVNAGHNPPLIRRSDGKFAYLRDKPCLVLACVEEMPYTTQELYLQPGDTVFLYTDGVTEATNAAEELYGEERLLAAINSRSFRSMEELCAFMQSEIAAFVGEAPQFDDITMVAFRYDGPAPAAQA